MDISAQVIATITAALNLQHPITAQSALLGALPEFDSSSILTIITLLEEQFGITFDDDDISAELFKQVQHLIDYVQQQLAAA
jgi:acyl carrier protein